MYRGKAEMHFLFNLLFNVFLCSILLRNVQNIVAMEDELHLF
jgi:hypothetical protein